MINTTVTIDETFQVLDSIPVTPPGSTLAQYIEAGLTQIVSQTLSVVFVTPKINSQYLFDELEVQNIVDANPLVLTPEVTAISTTGFSVAFNGIPTTTNSYLRWRVTIPI